jgi:hypothetical protein
VTYLWDSLNAVTPTIPGQVRSGDFTITNPHTTVFVGRRNAQGGAFALSNPHQLGFSGTAIFPAPQGRMTPYGEPFILVGSFNRTDATAVDEDVDTPDAERIALASGTTGEIGWPLTAPAFNLETDPDAQVLRGKVTNPASGSASCMLVLWELIDGVWTEVADSGTVVVPGNTSDTAEVDFSISDLDDSTGAHLGVSIRLL